MEKQVDKSHYSFESYLDKGRWASIWHQLNEVARVNPDNVLEIGPGPGVFKAAMGLIGIRCETLDLDPELQPDYVASVFDMPFKNGAFDVVCAFQMLEHLPFDQSLNAVKEMSRVAKKSLILSLPDASVRWPFSLYIPKRGSFSFLIPKPRFGTPQHKFDGQHYWEINKKNYSLAQVIKEFTNTSKTIHLTKTFRVPEKPYHRFLVFEKY